MQAGRTRNLAVTRPLLIEPDLLPLCIWTLTTSSQAFTILSRRQASLSCSGYKPDTVLQGRILLPAWLLASA